MADDIIQRLGFDAGSAIATINNLKSALDSLNTTLQTTAGQFKGWNSGASSAAKAFASMEKAAASLLTQFNALAKAQANLMAGGGPAPAANKGIQGQLAMIRNLTNAWGQMSNSVPAATRQAFAQGVAQAAQFANANKLSAQQILQAYTTMGQGVAGKVGQLGQMFQNLANMHASATTKMTQGTQGLTFSLKDMLVSFIKFRVVLAGITAIIGKFTAGIAQAAEYSRALGRIATVLPQEEVEFFGADTESKAKNIANIMENVKGELLEMSDLYGKSLGDVSEAYYLTLQNQVGDSAESLNVLNEAAKVGVATNTDLNTSVDTLTVALNGFKLGASSAGDVAGKLFKATEIGRFQFRDMADTMGRVNAIAESLGISLSEVLGPMATMTRQGVRFDTSVTQMRATISQLLKPTERLKEIFRDWGVEDVQQAIGKFGGLHPMLMALEDVLRGNSSAMAEAFTNLRAFTGVMSTLGRNAEQTAEDIAKINAAGQEVADAVYATVAKTQGQKLAETWNQVSNSFVRLGDKLLPIVNLMASFAAFVARVVAALGPTGLAGALGVTLVLMKANIVAVFTWAKSFVAVQLALSAMMKYFPLIAAFLLGWKLGEIISGWIDGLRGFSREADKLHLDLLKKEQEYTDWAIKNAAKRYEAVSQEVKGMKNTLISYLSEANKIHNQITDDVMQANSIMVDSLKDQLEGILDDQEKLVTKLRDTAENGGKAMLDAQKDYTKASQTLSDKEFGFKIDGYDNVRKANAEMQRSQQMMSVALSKFRAAKLPADIEAAKEELAAAARYAESATSSAGTEAKNRGVLATARRNELQIAKALVDMEARRIQLIQQEAATAQAIYAKEQERLNKMKEAVKDILEGYTMFTGEGKDKKPKSEAQVMADTAKAEEAWGKLLASMSADKAADPMQLLGLADLRQKLDAAAGKLPALKAQVTFEYKEQFQQITTAFRLLPKEIKIQFTDGQGNNLIDIMNPLTDIMSKLADQSGEFDELKDSVAQFDGALQGVKSTISGRLDPFKEMVPNQNILNKPTTNLNELSQAYNRFIQSTQALKTVDPSNVEGFSQALSTAQSDHRELLAQMEKHPIQTLIGAVDTNAIAQMGNALKAIRQEYYGSIKNADPLLLGAVQRSQAIADNMLKIAGAFQIDLPTENLKTLAGAWQAAAEAAPTINTNAEGTNTAMAGIATNSERAASAYERMQQASSNIRAPRVSLDEEAKGGLMRLAAGGSVFKPHGTDTIPAMLTRGEFVVNAAATRRFYSQLVAMNAGVKPVYRQDGGAVTNVGDINVSVNGSSSTRQTAREIATALRREVRRGTSKL
jgi:TP901 family phage tail tape measure protein